MRQRWIVLFTLIVVVAFLAYLVLAIDLTPWRSPAVAASNSPCVPAGATCIALNPVVTAENIASTICTSGYTKKHLRSDADYVNSVKIKIGHKVGLASDARVEQRLKQAAAAAGWKLPFLPL